MAQDVRERLVFAAEYLIACRGIDVSLRDIAVAAGQRNNTVVQYHFGSRDGLIEAVIEYRDAALEKRRMELLADLESSGRVAELRDLVDVLVRPLFEFVTGGKSAYYGRFLEAVRSHPAVADRARFDAGDRAAARIILTRLFRLLDQFPPPSRERRMRAMATAAYALLADLERECEADPASNPGMAAGTEIITMLTAMLTAT